MYDYWKRSRITKALTDALRVGSFAEAESRLNEICVTVVVGADQAATAAGQAAALTAISTAQKCFGRVLLVLEADVFLVARLPIGKTLKEAAEQIGALISTEVHADTTHTIFIGSSSAGVGLRIYCWWDRWLAGLRKSREIIGDSRLALSGVFSAALAVRQVFASILTSKKPHNDSTVSLWTPWSAANLSETGPEVFDVPDQFWFLGMGHLGQGFVWNLCLMGIAEGRAIIQDNQVVAEENEATSLLVSGEDLGQKKVRVAERWLSAAGWKADLVERRHYGDIILRADDPPYLLCGVDDVAPRQVMAGHGFEFMIDAGLGHGPYDFEGIQIRVVGKNGKFDDLWEKKKVASSANNDGKLDVDLENARKQSAPYQDLEKAIGSCGIVKFAEASTSVPFVGAAAGALVIGYAIRLASLKSTPRFMQMELGAPHLTSSGGLVSSSVGLGSPAKCL